MDPAVRNKAIDWFYQLFAWDQSERQRIDRAAAAMGYGLDPNQYVHPFPGSPPSNTVINMEPSKRNMFVPLCFIGLLGLVAGLSIALWYSLPSKHSQSPQEWEIKWKVREDGEWMDVKPAR